MCVFMLNVQMYNAWMRSNNETQCFVQNIQSQLKIENVFSKPENIRHLICPDFIEQWKNPFLKTIYGNAIG